MTKNSGQGDQNGKERLALGKPWFVILVALTLCIIFIEFFHDVRHDLLFYQLVIITDLLLLASFFATVVVYIRKSELRLIDLIRREKPDAAFLLLLVMVAFLPRVASALVIARLAVAWLMRGLETNIGSRLLANLNLRPSQSLALSFMGLIGLGTLLLAFPAATTDGKGASLLNALFTMTSASCVAGLSVYDIGAEFTRFGQTVILFGMQAGGLGIMFLSAAFAVLVGGAVGGRRQKGFREALDVSTPEGLKSLIRDVAGTTVVMELFGIITLYFALSEEIPKTGDRLWWSIFHTVSAFCNAGLGLSPDSLMGFVHNPFVLLVFIILITSGGIGFFVMSDLTDPDLWQVKRPTAIWQRLQMQTKVVLVATLILDLSGMLLFLFFEYDGALHGLSVKNKILGALFHAVSLRSAGFNVMPIGGLAGPSIILSIVFMFIGASPGSTGGGIKTTTAAVSVMSLRAMLHGRREVEMFGRRLESSAVSRSLSIALVSAMILAFFLTLLLSTQDIPFEKLLFEVVSAFGTVGLSMDTTPLLNNTGKLLIIMVMYIGRIGPLTLALAIGGRKIIRGYHFPNGTIAVG